MNKVLVLIFMLLNFTSVVFSKNNGIGPYAIRYVAFPANVLPRNHLREPMRIVAENSVNGRKYVTAGVNPTVEVPPGLYRFEGSSDSCKIQPQVAYVTKSRIMVLKAICI